MGFSNMRIIHENQVQLSKKFCSDDHGDMKTIFRVSKSISGYRDGIRNILAICLEDRQPIYPGIGVVHSLMLLLPSRASQLSINMAHP